VADGLFSLRKLPPPRLNGETPFSVAAKCAREQLCYRLMNGLPMCKKTCVKLEVDKALQWWKA
jgi:hypothetical protein